MGNQFGRRERKKRGKAKKTPRVPFKKQKDVKDVIVIEEPKLPPENAVPPLVVRGNVEQEYEIDRRKVLVLFAGVGAAVLGFRKLVKLIDKPKALSPSSIMEQPVNTGYIIHHEVPKTLDGILLNATPKTLQMLAEGARIPTSTEHVYMKIRGERIEERFELRPSTRPKTALFEGMENLGVPTDFLRKALGYKYEIHVFNSTTATRPDRQLHISVVDGTLPNGDKCKLVFNASVDSRPSGDPLLALVRAQTTGQFGAQKQYCPYDPSYYMSTTIRKAGNNTMISKVFDPNNPAVTELDASSSLQPKPPAKQGLGERVASILLGYIPQ